MSTSKINIHNLHEYLQYEVVAELEQLVITWDTTNDELNRLMRDEYVRICSNDYYNNSLWVNEVKKMIGYEEGTSYVLIMYSYLSNERLVIQSTHLNIPNFYLKLDENGYLLLRPNRREDENYYRCHCLYNDLLDDELASYVLK